MKRRNVRFDPIFFGIALVTTAILLILDGVGLSLGAGIGPVRIILGVAFLAWLIYELVKLDIKGIFFPIAFLFITFKEPIETLTKTEMKISNWTVILAALLLTIGFDLMIHKAKKIETGNVNIGNRIGTSSIYLDSKDLGDANISDIVGFANVFFTSRESYAGGGRINIHDNAGNVTLHIPSDWYVTTQVSDNIGNIYIPEQKVYGGKSLELCVHNNVGKVSVVFEM